MSSSANINKIRPWASAGLREPMPEGEIDAGWVPGQEPAAEYENDRNFSRDTILNDVADYLNGGVPLQDLRPGGVALDGGSGVSLIFQASPGYSRVRIEEPSSGFATEMSKDRQVSMLLSASDSRRTEITADGIKFAGTLGFSHQSEALRTVQIDVSGFAWSSGNGDYYGDNTAVDATGLAFEQVRVANAYVETDTIGNTRWSAPLYLQVAKTGAGGLQITGWRVPKLGYPLSPAAVWARAYVTFEILPTAE